MKDLYGKLSIDFVPQPKPPKATKGPRKLNKMDALPVRLLRQVYVGRFFEPKGAKTRQDAPKTRQDAPKTHPRRPKMRQEALKTGQRRPKRPPRRAKTRPRRPKMPPDLPRTAKISAK